MNDGTLFGVVQRTLGQEDQDTWEASNGQDCKSLAIYTPTHSINGFHSHLYFSNIGSPENSNLA